MYETALPENENKRKSSGIRRNQNNFKTNKSCYPDLNWRPHPYQAALATRNRLELSTSSVTGWRSNQLNYRAIYVNGKNPEYVEAGAEGIEPSARGFGDRCSTC